MSPIASAMLFWLDEAAKDLLRRWPALLRLLPHRNAIGTYFHVRARMDGRDPDALEAMAVTAPPWLRNKLWRIAGGEWGQQDEYAKGIDLVRRAAAAETWPAYRYEQLGHAAVLRCMGGDWQAGRAELTVVRDWYAARPVVRRFQHRRWYYLNYFLWAAAIELGDEESAHRHAWEAWRAGNREERAEMEPYLVRPAPT